MVSLPSAPKVYVLPGDTTPVTGLTRNGNPAIAYGSIVLSIDGLQESYRTNATYGAQIELMRYRPSSKKKTKAGSYRKIGQYMAHPSPPSAGSGSGGTRGGTINGLGPGVTRPTEWPIFGLPFGGTITLNVADVLLPYFQIDQIIDVNGTVSKALNYFIGSSRRRNPRGVWSYAKNPFRGIFAFRISVLDTSVSPPRRVNGPMSRIVFARPKKWPTKYTNIGADYPKLRLISNEPQGDYLELVAGLGGVVR